MKHKEHNDFSQNWGWEFVSSSSLYQQGFLDSDLFWSSYCYVLPFLSPHNAFLLFTHIQVFDSALSYFWFQTLYILIDRADACDTNLHNHN